MAMADHYEQGDAAHVGLHGHRPVPSPQPQQERCPECESLDPRERWPISDNAGGPVFCRNAWHSQARYPVDHQPSSALIAALAEAEARVEAAEQELTEVCALKMDNKDRALLLAEVHRSEQALASQTKLLREVAEWFQDCGDGIEEADRDDDPLSAYARGAMATWREAASYLRSRLSTVEGAEDG